MTEPTRAQIAATEALAEMRVAHRDDERWKHEHFLRFTEMCMNAGVRFDADMCDEVCRVLYDVDAMQEVEAGLRHLGLEPWNDGRSINDSRRTWAQHVNMVIASLHSNAAESGRALQTMREQGDALVRAADEFDGSTAGLLILRDAASAWRSCTT